MTQDNVKSCLEEVSKVIFNFLEAQGGYSNGYYTYVSGVVNAKGEEPRTLDWTTPKAKDELTQKGKDKRSNGLYKEIQGKLRHFGMSSVLIRYRDVEFGCMEIEVVHIEEIKTKVPLYRLP